MNINDGLIIVIAVLDKTNNIIRFETKQYTEFKNRPEGSNIDKSLNKITSEILNQINQEFVYIGVLNHFTLRWPIENKYNLGVSSFVGLTIQTLYFNGEKINRVKPNKTELLIQGYLIANLSWNLDGFDENKSFFGDFNTVCRYIKDEEKLLKGDFNDVFETKTRKYLTYIGNAQPRWCL